MQIFIPSFFSFIFSSEMSLVFSGIACNFDTEHAKFLI